MKSDRPTPPTELQQLIEQGKVIRVLSRATRARVLKRARLSISSGAPSAPSQAVPRRVRASSVAWLGGAAAIGLVGAAFALHDRPTRSAAVPSPLGSASATCVQTATPSASVAAILPALTPEVAGAAAVARQARPAPAAESYAAELELLQRAHGAFRDRDFPTTLRLLTEHARRFQNGRLAEEREALRVRALSGSGRMESARVAASAFAVRFPRSVFLARTSAALETGGTPPK